MVEQYRDNIVLDGQGELKSSMDQVKILLSLSEDWQKLDPKSDRVARTRLIQKIKHLCDCLELKLVSSKKTRVGWRTAVHRELQEKNGWSSWSDMDLKGFKYTFDEVLVDSIFKSLKENQLVYEG